MLVPAGLATFAAESSCVIKGLISFLTCSSWFPKPAPREAPAGPWQLVSQLTHPSAGRRHPGQEHTHLCWYQKQKSYIFIGIFLNVKLNFEKGGEETVKR